MNIVERSVSAGDRAVFDLEEFLARPLYAHLAHNSDQGPRESPVWFHWDGRAVWIIGGTSFPANLKRDPPLMRIDSAIHIMSPARRDPQPARAIGCRACRRIHRSPTAGA